jgi:phospho-N-acetylmuramoyl-pentapeptide-transferase
MLHYLLEPYFDDFILFNLFRYVTFRAAGGMATALFLSFLLGPRVIRWLRRVRVGQVVREEGPKSHLQKAGTPTMGGALIILATVISTLLWARLANGYVVMTLLVLLWLGSLGFLDYYLKVVGRRNGGGRGSFKMIWQGGRGEFIRVDERAKALKENLRAKTTRHPGLAAHKLRLEPAQ